MLLLHARTSRLFAGLVLLLGLTWIQPTARAQSWVFLTDVPDYEWYAGCFGTASGNLMGYWDRHGMDDFYTGPTGGGLAPLETRSAANKGIRSLWTSKAGVDGRPADQPGHIDDYWINYSSDVSYSYESTAPDPYVTAHRPEHTPDCIGDFIGLSQNKWTNLANECAGNIDAYSFVFWDKTGRRRSNFAFTNATGQYIPDIQSGFRAWTRSRGYEADVFTQLTSFNPERTSGAGFTYADVKAEIDAGYPVLCFLQPQDEFSRSIAGMTNANPEIHGVMIYGYIDDPSIGISQSVLIRTSWGLGTESIQPWALSDWLNLFPVRGVIGYHPKPKVRTISRGDGSVSITWDGPSAQLTDMYAPPGTAPTRTVHRYQVEASLTPDSSGFQSLGPITTARSITLPDCCQESRFYRVRLVSP